jgi:hypothetical protein
MAEKRTKPAAGNAARSKKAVREGGVKASKPGKASGGGARDVCFVIMPFGGWLDDYYEEIYKPAIASAHLEVHRADDLFRPSTIVNDIWSYTKRAKLLLADLTGRNPNVFYELGLAHALGKPAILIAESMDEVPFDLRALRVIIYDKNAPDWGSILNEKIASSIKEVLASPVAAVLPAFLELNNSSPKPVLTEGERQFAEMKQEIELLRHELRSSQERSSTSRRGGPSQIDPPEARDLISHFLSSGLSTSAIIRRVEPLGPPADWILRTIEEMGPAARKRRAYAVSARPSRSGSISRAAQPSLGARPAGSGAAATASAKPVSSS